MTAKRTALSFLFLVFAASLWAQELPRAISSYYLDWNYVARNSTGPQRQVLWKAYRRHETAVLTGTEQEILVRMNRVADATDSRHFSMPMLLAGTAPPVTSELLVPNAHATIEPTRALVQVKVFQNLAHGAATAGGSLFRIFGPKEDLMCMCQYTDEWTQHDGQWKVLRSPVVWVSSNESD